MPTWYTNYRLQQRCCFRIGIAACYAFSASGCLQMSTESAYFTYKVKNRTRNSQRTAHSVARRLPRRDIDRISHRDEGVHDEKSPDNGESWKENSPCITASRRLRWLPGSALLLFQSNLPSIYLRYEGNKLLPTNFLVFVKELFWKRFQCFLVDLSGSMLETAASSSSSTSPCVVDVALNCF